MCIYEKYIYYGKKNVIRNAYSYIIIVIILNDTQFSYDIYNLNNANTMKHYYNTKNNTLLLLLKFPLHCINILKVIIILYYY